MCLMLLPVLPCLCDANSWQCSWCSVTVANTCVWLLQSCAQGRHQQLYIVRLKAAEESQCIPGLAFGKVEPTTNSFRREVLLL